MGNNAIKAGQSNVLYGQLKLPSQGSSYGVLIGGDTQLYRASAGRLSLGSTTELIMQGAEKILFRDSALNISSKNDGRLDIDADTAIDLNSPLTVIWTDDKLIFRDSDIFIHSDADARLIIQSDGSLRLNCSDIRIYEYMYHSGDEDTYIRYENDSIKLVAGATSIMRVQQDSLGFFGVTNQAQQAHIVDADGTLADITAKFNTLLADLEGYGLLASA